MTSQDPPPDHDAETIDVPPEVAPGAAAADAPAPERIGRYRILSAIGAGGMGTVYLAMQEHPRRRVALKVMKRGVASRSALRRFEYESQILARLRHPNIAQVYEAGTHDDGEGGVPYFAMEYVPNAKPITDYAAQKNLGTRERLALFMKVCDAVHHGHQKGIIHRDLKPNNIIVDSDGEPKIIDFGVARATDSDMALTTLQTDLGQLVGTLQYMSPEQCDADPQDLDIRSDVYSLGVVLYELLTRQLPYDLRRATILEAARRIRDAAPARPSSIVRTLRGDVETITLKALEKERHRRYQSSSQLAHDIDRYLRSEPIEARPPSAAYRMSLFARRNKLVVGAAAGIALALVIGLALALHGLNTATRERDEKERALAESQLVTSFLANMLAAVEPEAQGHQVTVREVLDEASRTVHEQFADRPRLEARLRHTLSNSYRALGELGLAAEHAEAALRLREQVLGPDHRETLRSLSNLASLRHQQGAHDEALMLNRRAIDGWIRTVGERDRETLGVMNNQAQILTTLGLTAEAVDLQRRVLALQQEVLGPAHENTLGSMVNLAVMLRELGRLDEAGALYRECLEGWQTHHGPRHPGTLLAAGSVAFFELETGRPAEAEARLRETLATCEEALGPRHMHTITTRHLMGRALLALGEIADGESHLLVALDRAVDVYGPRHDRTFRIVFDLVGLYERLDWPEAAAAPIERGIKLLRGVVGARTVTTGNLNSAAWFLLTVRPEHLRDPGVALSLATEACRREREGGGGQLWVYLDTLALAQFETGDAATALATQEECLRLMPPEGEPFRGELEAHLARYRDAVK